MPGTRLGVYEVTAQLGVGGMGEVYRATDTKLKRQVAIKILPSSLATDPDRLARFQREAEVLASLNHPNIAAIYGLEDADRMKALVLELVEGATLADRIAHGPIPFDEALPVARQIVEAIEAAHQQGIIHRDLKPANIKVRADGTVKVLDFGLAKALEPVAAAAEATVSPTITSPAMTQTGVIRYCCLHESGTSEGAPCGQTQRRLVARLRVVRNAHRQTCVRGRRRPRYAGRRASSGTGLAGVAGRCPGAHQTAVATFPGEGSQQALG